MGLRLRPEDEPGGAIAGGRHVDGRVAQGRGDLRGDEDLEALLLGDLVALGGRSVNPRPMLTSSALVVSAKTRRPWSSGTSCSRRSSVRSSAAAWVI